MSIESDNRHESARVKALRDRARKRPHLTPAKFGPRSQGFTLPRTVLGYSNAVAMGDAVRKAIVAREYALAHREDGLVVHVKDGKPLTAH